LAGHGDLQRETVCAVMAVRNEERKIAEEAVESVIPSIVYISEFLESVRRDIEESVSLRDFLRRIEERISTEKDATRRTDFSILRNELLRRMRDITAGVER
jgi:hypothetical protein